MRRSNRRDVGFRETAGSLPYYAVKTVVAVAYTASSESWRHIAFEVNLDAASGRSFL